MYVENASFTDPCLFLVFQTWCTWLSLGKLSKNGDTFESCRRMEVCLQMGVLHYSLCNF